MSWHSESRMANLVEPNIAKWWAALEYLKKLVSICMLLEQEGGRERLFINHQIDGPGCKG